MISVLKEKLLVIVSSSKNYQGLWIFVWFKEMKWNLWSHIKQVVPMFLMEFV